MADVLKAIDAECAAVREDAVAKLAQEGGGVATVLSTGKERRIKSNDMRDILQDLIDGHRYCGDGCDVVKIIDRVRR